jgi:hypothetical protein
MATIKTHQTGTVLTRYVELNRSERCDAECPAAAQVMAILPAGPLLFCTHHGLKFRTALLDQGAEILEQG